MRNKHRSFNDGFLGFIGYCLLAVVVFGLFFLRGLLVSPETAKHALDVSGFSNITITDKAWFVVGVRGCSERDAARFTAKATNPKGDQVTLFVCDGWPFKAATIRVW
jgi:hypothetical protein